MWSFFIHIQISGIYYALIMALAISTSLTKEQISEFQELYIKHYNIELTDDEAIEKGVRFLQFMTVLIENNNAFFDD